MGDEVADIPIGENVGTVGWHELSRLPVIGVGVDSGQNSPQTVVFPDLAGVVGRVLLSGQCFRGNTGVAVGVPGMAGGVEQLAVPAPVAASEVGVLSRLVGAGGSCQGRAVGQEVDALPIGPASSNATEPCACRAAHKGLDKSTAA